MKLIKGGRKPKRIPNDKLSTSELRQRFIDESEIFISRIVHDGKLLSLWIELRGSLAAIPSLKNEKSNFGGLNRTAEQKIKSMDIIFLEDWGKTWGDSYTFGKERVLLQVISGSRPQTFDAISPVETVQDWLEPKSKIVGAKIKRKRGWGIGMIEDDSQVIPLPAKYSDLSAKKTEQTLIHVMRFDTVRDRFIQFHADLMLLNGRKEK